MGVCFFMLCLLISQIPEGLGKGENPLHGKKDVSPPQPRQKP